MAEAAWVTERKGTGEGGGPGARSVWRLVGVAEPSKRCACGGGGGGEDWTNRWEG